MHACLFLLDTTRIHHGTSPRRCGRRPILKRPDAARLFRSILHIRPMTGRDGCFWGLFPGRSSSSFTAPNSWPECNNACPTAQGQEPAGAMAARHDSPSPDLAAAADVPGAATADGHRLGEGRKGDSIPLVSAVVAECSTCRREGS